MGCGSSKAVGVADPPTASDSGAANGSTAPAGEQAALEVSDGGGKKEQRCFGGRRNFPPRISMLLTDVICLHRQPDEGIPTLQREGTGLKFDVG